MTVRTPWWLIAFAVIALVAIGAVAAWRHESGGRAQVFVPTTSRGAPFARAPHRLVLGGGMSLENVVWTDWGAGTAFARGRVASQVCVVGCELAGRRLTYHTVITVKASDLGPCDGRTVYRELSGSRTLPTRGCAYS